ncbi:MAG: diguanylate cyclase [Thalassobaculum sp.]|uniref:sensor domain-containing diguanylate cyclase n=1 Tax=Thalassobaculum sp. TaxID=2022740 RepID=UPI0032ECC2A9
MSNTQQTTLFAALLQASLDGIVVLRPMAGPDGGFADLVFETVNRRAEEILARGAGGLVGLRALRDFFDGDDAAFDKYRRVWLTGEPARFEVDRRSGPAGRVFRGAIVRADDRIVVTFSDVTELVEANEVLERQRVELLYQYELLDEQAADLARIAEDSDAARAEARNGARFVADLLEAMPLPVFFKSREDRRFRMTNRLFAELHGSGDRDATGSTVDDFFEAETVASIDRLDQQFYDSPAPRQVYETDMTFAGAGYRRMVVHKAKMRDAENRLIGITGVMVDVTEAHRLRQELERLATTDPLTGLANRRAFLERAAEEVERASRHDRPMSVVMIDVDHFKAINDRHGHDIGDQVLQRVAEVVGSTLRQAGDLAARFGGEEFVLLLPETPLGGARMLAERIREAFEVTRVDTDDGPVNFTASFGVDALRPGLDAGIDAVIKRADDALYRAKAAGRNRVHLAA